MFERFTPRARRVIVLAQDTARTMSHPQIRPEHLLVALREGEGMAASAMEQSGVDLAALRQRVAESIEPKPWAGKAHKVPFSNEGKKALELSLRAALALGHNYIGTEHLFVGVEREAEHRGGSLDGLLGVPAAQVHQRLTSMLGSTPPPMGSPGLQAAMDAARREAGQAPMTTGNVLSALMADADSQASRALASLGVTAEAVQGALDAVPVATTSDAAASPQTVAVTIGETTRVITDPGIATALQDLSDDRLREVLKKAVEPGEAAG